MLLLAASTSATNLLPADPRAAITDRVRGEFREMPGLALTLAQAGRLWRLDAATCNNVLTTLVEAGFLCKRADGMYSR